MKPRLRKYRTLSPEQAKQWLQANGYTVRQFCRDHGIDVAAAYEILNRRTVGRSGKAHAAAVALGLKPPQQEGSSKLPARKGGVFSED